MDRNSSRSKTYLFFFFSLPFFFSKTDSMLKELVCVCGCLCYQFTGIPLGAFWGKTYEHGAGVRLFIERTILYLFCPLEPDDDAHLFGGAGLRQAQGRARLCE